MKILKQPICSTDKAVMLAKIGELKLKPALFAACLVTSVAKQKPLRRNAAVEFDQTDRHAFTLSQRLKRRLASSARLLDLSNNSHHHIPLTMLSSLRKP
ncbi:hypothetical protein T08_13765 [Trichinella sp. T8]|nr:hypothetical protein T08_13765 [Trichinella sp. T8]